MPKNIKINISGMTCVNCSNAIERIAKKTQGVLEARVNFANALGEFVVENDNVKEQLENKIKKLGYGIAKDFLELENSQKKHILSLRNNLIIAFVISIIIMMFEMIGEMSKFKVIIMLVLSFFVIAFCGRGFFIHAYGSLKNKNFDMNVLVALGASVAFFYSLFVFVFENLVPENLRHIYVSSSAMIITFILLGKLLEESSKFRAGKHLKALMDLTPKTALLLKSDGQITQIDAAKLKIDDVVAVKSGFVVPSDGVIISGGAEIDTSMLTGESLPIYKKAGDLVNAGTINTNGYLNIKITKPLTQTLLTQILNLLSDATSKKMPISRFADKVANIFVPSVIFISLITFLVWYFIAENPLQGLLCAVCVLIISCPCALGLATPIAIISSLSVGAKAGILVKNPEVMEILKDVKFAVFDKTGTLTKAQICINFTNLSDENFSKVVALEAKSSHPISRAFVKYANELAIGYENLQYDFVNVAGKGVKSGDNAVIVGNETFLNEFNIFLNDLQKSEILEKTADGSGFILVATDGKYAGFATFSDSVKENAKSVINELKAMGICPIMLTGDNENTAKSVANTLEIDKIYAGVLPHEKFEIIKQIQNDGKVIFVGDGINDSVALKQSNIGVAMSSGSDVAKEAGDIVLITNDLKNVVLAIKLGKMTMKTIKQNLFWAFIYNIICIPVAAGILYPIGILLTPAFGALAMSFSSVTVVLNSIRLRKKCENI
ncbi:MAG: heavy metal translocating P-type ATPase [Campylobacter sp.]